jgi:hypothetical protein
MTFVRDTARGWQPARLAMRTREPAGWEIASMHNALVFPFAGAPGNKPVS